jgi:tetratricopeptide (TPR) repeat protein
MDEPPDPIGPIENSPPLAGEQVAFTGTLASMTHRQAIELAEQHGGAATEHVSRQTTMLVVGEEDCPLDPDGQPTIKLRRFLEWQERGVESRLVTESDWLRLLGLTDHQRQVKRLCTSAMLSELLGMPLGAVRRWERVGLIRPVKKVFRLAYFDFAEVAAARRLSELLASGISSARIKASLEKIGRLLPHVERPLAQLEMLAGDSQLFYRDDAGLVEPVSGQRYFDFATLGSEGSREGDETEATALPFTADATPPAAGTAEGVDWSADRWFQEGCRLGDAGDVTGAVQAFRLSLMRRPGEPVALFHLAEALYRLGKPEAATERYFAAVEHDPEFIEAWTQLGCVLEESGDAASALLAFDAALGVHPDYPDAHRHKAAVLDRLGREDEAVAHWRQYLHYDDRGPWADEARRRLEAHDARG